MKLNDIVAGIKQRLDQLRLGQYELDFGDFSVFVNGLEYRIEDIDSFYGYGCQFAGSMNIELRVCGMATQEGMEGMRRLIDPCADHLSYYKKDVIVKPQGTVLQGVFVREMTFSDLSFYDDLNEFEMVLCVDNLVEGNLL